MGLVVTSPNLQSVATIQGVSTLELQLGKSIKPENQPIKKEFVANNKYALWGEDNLDPYMYDDLIGENTALSGALQRKIDKFYAGGLEYGMLNDNGEFETKFDPYWQSFIESPHVRQYLDSAFECYVKYRAFFPQITFNEPKTKILKIRNLPAKECRWGLQNNQNGIIDKAFWGKNWEIHAGIKDTIEYPVFDELFHEDDYVQNVNGHIFVFQPNISGPNTYYQPPLWMPSVLQGWHRHSMQVPDWYESLMNNITALQFEIIFSETYFTTIYGERWDNGDEKDRLKMMEERLEHIYSMMKGTENAGKNIANMKQWNAEAGEFEKAFEIKPLDIKTFNGQYLENLREADQHIIWSAGEDPISMGSHGSGSNDGVGGGKKAAFNGDMATNCRHSKAILAPFYFKKRFENHDPRLSFRIKLPYLADLNQVTNDKRNSGYPDNNKPDNANLVGK